ncbi:hypothetical protein [Methylophilus sp. 14]|uniref:hypothetical protein n=1 Tax=Methylophilus sp. 14 TaxID=2781019 RepID=UPI0018901AFD|nr:hypothetical protein [Methylophilus sp. 14]MBF4987060.1 hypothetical protein [Methylophilus sp. 14]
MNKGVEELIDAVVRLGDIHDQEESSRWSFITKKIWFRKPVLRLRKYRQSRALNKNIVDKPLLEVVPKSNPNIIASSTPRSSIYVVFAYIQKLADWYRRKLIERQILEKRTIPFLMSVGLIKISDDGDITVHSAPIQPDVANILAFSIAAISGCCVFWIIFIAQAGLVTIIQSTGIGLIIGTLISLLHDFSYKKEVILKHIENITDY